MKSIAKPIFSAYPLRAIKDPSSADKQPGSPYLKALLSGKTQSNSRVRVLPMVNPYTKQFKPSPFEQEKLPKDIELVQKNWFNNYE